MDSPILKLVFNKGPREGETIESHPSSKIRIGRVLRGNTLAIKDAGISQKHLSIEFNGVNWTISDLDSSNGTFLNESQINALKPFNLSDGDTIKIGERTSFLVKVEVKDENSNSKGIDSQPRRNAPRQNALKKGVPKKDQLQVSVQQMPNSVASYCEKQEHEALGLEAELDAPANKGRGLRRRGVTKKVEGKKHTVPVHQVEDCPEPSILVSGMYGTEEKVALEADAMLEAPDTANKGRGLRRRGVAKKAEDKKHTVPVHQLEDCPEPSGLVSGRHGAEEKVALEADAKLEAPDTANKGRGLRRRGVAKKAEDKKHTVPVHQLEDCPEPSGLVSGRHGAEEKVALEADAMLEAPDTANKGRRLGRRGIAKKAEGKKHTVLVHQVEGCPEPSGLVSGTHGAEEKVALEADAVLEAPANNARVKRQRRVVTRAAAKRDPVLVCEIQEIPENFESDHVKKWGRMAVGVQVERTAHLNDCEVSEHQENGSTGGEYENISTSPTNVNGGKECQGSVRGATDRIHWEKITLGEWFDRMEKYLPQKINEIADEIIEKLRNRQKQFDEYVSEHNKENQ